MYARIAHFAGIAPGCIDEQVAEMKRQSAAAMNEMSPDDEDGRRTGPADIYEVVLDESY
jgi:hypothetical protein